MPFPSSPAPTPPSSLALHHLALKVRRLETAEQFYHQLLGLPVLRRWEDAEGRPRSIWLDGSGFILMLERSEQAAGEPVTAELPPFPHDPPGWRLAAFRIAPGARATWRTYLETHGIAIVHETAYTLYVQDPEGNRIALSHYPDPASG